MKKQVSKKELQIVVLTIIFCQLVIDFIDELSYTRFFKNKVKMVAKNLQRLLEPKVDAIFTDKTSADAANQLIDISRMVYKIAITLLNVDEIHYIEFTNQYKMMLQRFYVPNEIIEEVFEV